MAFRQHLILKDAAFNFIFDKVCELGCAITEKEREIESLNIDLASLELANDLAPKSKRILKSIYDVEKMKAQLIAKLLGYENFDNYEEVAVYPKGYRILKKI